MNNYVIYRGKIYISESTDTKTDNGFSLSALADALNDKAEMAKLLSQPISNSQIDISDKKEQLKLVGAQLSKMDLWNPILEYFGKYFIDNASKDVLSDLSSVQKTLLDKINKLGIKVANEYRELRGKYVSDEYRTKDDTQFRKVTTIFKHYFYFVALYNLEFLEYIEANVKNSNVFTKEFADKLPTLYDPPKPMYIESDYLNPKSKSEFNNSVLNRSDWESELDEKANDVSSGFSKNEKWDFERLKELYIVGLPVQGVNNDKGAPVYIEIGDVGNPNRKEDITNINELINNIHRNIVDGLTRLKPNLIRSSIKNVGKETASIDLSKKEITDKTKKVSEPYQTGADLAKNKANFAGTAQTDKDSETVANSSKFTADKNSIVNRIKSKLGGKNK
jgi:hypothetical protein